MPARRAALSTPARVAVDDFFPPAKRVKRDDSISDANDTSFSTSDGESILPEPSHRARETIPDSEAVAAADDDDYESEVHLRLDPHLPTELESALPPVKAEKEAILEYESFKAAEDRVAETSKGLSKYRSSIYVDAFNLSLDTVLQDEGHLFNEAEMAVFDHWQKLDYEAQYLYVRLFLRKTASWHRISQLGYWNDISDLPGAADVLQLERELSGNSIPLTTKPVVLNSPDLLSLDTTFTFADASSSSITTLEEASSILKLEELKVIAKDAKVQGKNKGELLKAFQRMSQQQSGLGRVGLRRSDSEISTGVDNPGDADVSGFEDDNRDRHFLRKILATTGPCIRLSHPVLKLFERVHLVFYRSTEWTDKSLTSIILARISRLHFPRYIISRSANIFPSRAVLLEFEAAIRTQFRVDSILEFNGNPGKAGLEEVMSIFEEVYPRWQVLLEEEQNKEDHIYESGEGAYMRRFSPAWVYTRIVHKATSVLGKVKMHAREHEVLWNLLNQRLFHAARRGAWYQRAALLEEHYMAALNSSPQRSRLVQEQRRWKSVALRTCEQGLQDRDVHAIYHYDLQKRIRKLEKSIRIVKREQHDFGHVSFVKPVERIVQGIRVQKEYDIHLRNGRKSEELRARSTKTIWIDEVEGGGECSVESMCLNWYRSQDALNGVPAWKGYHAEGGILRTLFAYLFYDILFLYIPNVFQTQYQTCPLDLHTDGFYLSRASEINHRLVEIENGDAERLIRRVDGQEREKRTCIVGLNWDFELADLLEIAVCFEGPALAIICKVMAQEYRQRGGGVPDLFLWNAGKKEVMFAEVKSENDRLSDTQRLWIHVLMGAGIRVELCNAVAKEVRIVRCL